MITLFSCDRVIPVMFSPGMLLTAMAELLSKSHHKQTLICVRLEHIAAYGHFFAAVTLTLTP